MEIVSQTNSCTSRIKKSYRNVSIFTLYVSLGIVPTAKFLLAYFQMQQLLSDQKLFDLDEDSYFVKTSSSICGVISAYYSLGTEGAATLEWLSENHSIHSSWIPNKIREYFNYLTIKIAEKEQSLIMPLALIGAMNYSVLQTLSLFILLLKIESPILTSVVLSTLLFSDMALQNYTFQGREFKKNAKKLICYLQDKRFIDPHEYNYISEYLLSKPQFALLVAFNSIFIAIPTFCANFSLTHFTFISSFQEYFRQTRPSKWQIGTAAAFATVASVGEALTETVSAFDEVEKFVETRLCNRR